MSAAPGFLASLAAGLLSFLSPCVLPLIPAYLSFISGESVASMRSGSSSRFRLLARSLLFVAGFTLVFVALAVVAGGGMSLAGSSARVVINRVAGVLVAVLALNTLFDVIPPLRASRRAKEPMDAGKAVPAALRALFVGMAFAAGWTPCVGPILSSILLFAGSDGNVSRAAILLSAYSLGLGLPFILAGLFLDRLTPLLRFLARHGRAVRVASALLLLALAIAMVTGRLSALPAALARSGYFVEGLSDAGPEWLRHSLAAFGRWLRGEGA